MRFEGRDLKPYRETVTPKDLVIGHTYFSVSYIDEKMLVPVLYSVVYVGKNLEPGEQDKYYFQDVDSYTDGVRYGTTSKESPATFHTGDFVNSVQNYEQMLNGLLSCSLRRRDSALE